MNDDSNQTIGVVGLISVAAIVVIVVAVAAVGLVMTLVLSSSVLGSAAVPPADAIVDVTPTATATIAVEAASVESVTPADAAASADGGRIVIVSSDRQLITINSDGTDLRELTQRGDGIEYAFPAWSPDGQQLAAIGDDPGGIYVLRDSAESDVRSILTANVQPIYLYWSPTGEQVSFIIPNEEDASTLELNIASSDGSAESRKLASGVPFYWDWNSDGSELLFNTSDTPHADFAFLNMVDGVIGAEIEGGAFFASPDISADDAYIAYSAGARRSQRLVIADRMGVEQNNIRHFGLIAFAWSPVRNQLAYTTPRRPFPSAYGGLWLVEPQGEPRMLVDDDVITYYWSPDGSKIAYFTLAEGSGQDFEAARRSRTVLASDAPIRPIQDSSNARLDLSILDIASGRTIRIGRFLPSELFIRQFVPFFDQYARSHSLWAPNSSALVMPVQENGASVIYHFPIDGALPTKLLAGEIAFWSP